MVPKDHFHCTIRIGHRRPGGSVFQEFALIGLRLRRCLRVPELTLPACCSRPYGWWLSRSTGKLLTELLLRRGMRAGPLPNDGREPE